jgi:hypothetical protein
MVNLASGEIGVRTPECIKDPALALLLGLSHSCFELCAPNGSPLSCGRA